AAVDPSSSRLPSACRPAAAAAGRRDGRRQPRSWSLHHGVRRAGRRDRPSPARRARARAAPDEPPRGGGPARRPLRRQPRPRTGRGRRRGRAGGVSTRPPRARGVRRRCSGPPDYGGAV
ncbi:MAG: hypothetical protein AVDCRST_MAG16-794, partial [uncultured Frankineae bacterium]